MPSPVTSAPVETRPHPSPQVEVVPPAQWAALLSVLPARLYASDPSWVGLPGLWQRSRLNPDGPFFRDAEMVVFAARRQG